MYQKGTDTIFSHDYKLWITTFTVTDTANRGRVFER